MKNVFDFEVWNGLIKDNFDDLTLHWLVVEGSNDLRIEMLLHSSPPKTKPSINWDHVSPEWQWLAVDACQEAYMYDEKPILGPVSWTGDCDYKEADAFASYSRGTCDWKDSLVERPESE